MYSPVPVCESMFLLLHYTQLHILHQKFCFFHLLPHSCTSCFWNAVGKLVLIFLHCVCTIMTHKNYCFSSSCSTFYSPVCLKKHYCLWCSAQLQIATSPAILVQSTSPEVLLFCDCFLMVRHLRFSSQHLSLSHLFISVVFPRLCPPSLRTGRLPLNIIHTEISLPPGRKKTSSMLRVLHRFKMKPYLEWI